jgi:hypothetical protein
MTTEQDQRTLDRFRLFLGEMIQTSFHPEVDVATLLRVSINRSTLFLAAYIAAEKGSPSDG